MTSSSQHAASPRSRPGVRSWSIAVVTAGAVLLPAGSALADHMPGMNGTMCPHASGEGPDALAAPGPSEPAAPERAPSESPLALTGQSGPSSNAAPAPASKPAAQQVTRPATQVSKPATQVQTRVTTTAQSAPAATSAQSAVRAVATTPVAASKRAPAAQPRAKRAAPRARPERSFERRFNGLEPRASRPSLVTREAVEATPAVRPEVTGPTASVPLLVLFGLLTAGGLAAVVLVGRRRGGGGVVAGAPPQRPAAPRYADAAVEAELHEIIAEARARELLGPGEIDEPAERGESVGPR
jgi:hypothetical protein